MNKLKHIQSVGPSCSFDRRDFIKTAGAVVGAALIPVAGCPTGKSPQSARFKRPNLLFIWTDEQRADTMAAYGNTKIHAPNLNRLAEQSVVFERAEVQMKNWRFFLDL